MIAIKRGTVSFRHAEVLGPDEVEFTGTYRYLEDGLTPAMVWDAGLNNVRPMNQSERDTIDAAKATDAADATAWLVDKEQLRAAYAAAVSRLTQIRDAGSPTNAQVVQAVRDLAGYQLQIIKVLRRML